MSIRSFLRSRCLSAASRRWVALACGAVWLCCFASVVNARQVNVTVHAFPGSPGHVVIEGSCEPTKVWSFRNDYGGVSELGSRVAELKLFDAAGAEIPAHKIAPGQFEAAIAAAKFRYDVKLAPPARGSDAARVSWLNDERGLLMLAHLIPVSQSQAANSREGAKVVFKLPDSWAVLSNEKESPQGGF